MTELIMPRRKFLVGTSTLITSLFAGPAIVRATSLMDINSLDNRLVPAWRWYNNVSPATLSLMSFGEYTRGTMDDWSRYNTHVYSLERRGDVSIPPAFKGLTRAELRDKRMDIVRAVARDMEQEWLVYTRKVSSKFQSKWVDYSPFNKN